MVEQNHDMRNSINITNMADPDAISNRGQFNQYFQRSQILSGGIQASMNQSPNKHLMGDAMIA